MTDTCEDFLNWVDERNPNQPEFLQTVREVSQSVWPIYTANKQWWDERILHRLTEPDRIVSFRVAWEDDKNEVQINRGFRVQFSNALGPYKGGLRFHPTVNRSVLKFLGFEQTFKNALTGLPMGGGKGGADFDPRGRSDREIMRFCQSFMVELSRHIGPEVDVPAGDINVGVREIGYMFGTYKQITGRFEGVITGKEIAYGGSEMRVEATGYGLVFFVCAMLQHQGQQLDGMNVVISGAGNVATHAAEKAIEMGAKVLTLSDSQGFIYDGEGVTREKIAWVREQKRRPGVSLEGYAEEFGAKWHKGEKPWGVPCDVVLPCATQNELGLTDAQTLIGNNVRAVGEGANMPCTTEAIAAFRHAGVLLAPAKAANAGGVALSGLEISQNATRDPRPRAELAERLEKIMHSIHETCLNEMDGTDKPDYVRAANAAGFRKVAKALSAFGIL